MRRKRGGRAVDIDSLEVTGAIDVSAPAYAAVYFFFNIRRHGVCVWAERMASVLAVDAAMWIMATLVVLCFRTLARIRQLVGYSLHSA